jgi:hypothetical protein
MVGSVNSSAPVNHTPPAATQAPKAQPPKPPPQDSVQLSSAAGGDKDHDGDSH